MRTTIGDWRDVGKELLTEGIMWGETFRAGFPRRDLRVASRDVEVATNLALRSYVAFTRYGDGRTMVMGDLAVTEEELGRVTDVIQAAGLELTSVHKHLLAHSPALLWCHVHTLTEAPEVAARHIRAALETTGTPLPPRLATPTTADLDTGRLDAVLRGRGTDYAGTYKFTFARREMVVDHHRVIPWGMGAVTGVNFQPLGGERAAVNGALALTAAEVQPAIRALRHGGVDIVELHNHTLTEEPRLFFAHYWAVGDAAGLAHCLSEAVATTNVTWQATPGVDRTRS
ncbi:LppY/LpqO family protein [Streptomyces telluris]|uniref:DUF1259 domain-containing protein n=1 Tax=Streptomyces telluris TaxID=2720021 RepID=A0A9X2RP41_9ACTN|nr:LppY/LpqO family protein [Streptomyces telluris]MCQ8773607.1 DUF1259 domain-containing protein [Streptomyces telluris]